jgi:nucleoside-diphosphate-sugar epimerase
MIEDALLGRATRLPYGKGFPRQFIHVDDVVGAVLAALSISRVSGLATAINLTGGTRRNLDEVAGIVRTILPRADIELDAGDDPDDDFVGPLDLSAANQHLGWRPTISLDAGVRSYAAYLSGSGLIG